MASLDGAEGVLGALSEVWCEVTDEMRVSVDLNVEIWWDRSVKTLETEDGTQLWWIELLRSGVVEWKITNYSG